MWVLGENGTKPDRWKANLEVSAAESGKKKKEKIHNTQKSNFTPEEKRQKHRTQQFPVGEERRGLEGGGGGGGGGKRCSFRGLVLNFRKLQTFFCYHKIIQPVYNPMIRMLSL